MPDEPDIVQKLSVDFNVVNDVSIDFTSTPNPVLLQTESTSQIDANFNSNSEVEAKFISNVQPIDIQFGTIYVVGGDCRVLYATTETWNSQPELLSDRGYVYIYCDYRKNSQGQNIASAKIGDGSAYLIDLPFVDQLVYEHISDTVSHITQEEREFWNNKVRCYLSEVQNDNLIFTTE